MVLSDLNRAELTATVVQRDVIRYTPAGIPLLDCVLLHHSEQSEAGMARQVDFEIVGIATGSTANRLGECRLDRSYRFTGFLTNRSKKSKRIIFHIVDFESARKD